MTRDPATMSVAEMEAEIKAESQRVIKLHEEVRGLYEGNRDLRARICKRRTPIPPSPPPPITVQVPVVQTPAPIPAPQIPVAVAVATSEKPEPEVPKPAKAPKAKAPKEPKPKPAPKAPKPKRVIQPPDSETARGTPDTVIWFNQFLQVNQIQFPETDTVKTPEGLQEMTMSLDWRGTKVEVKALCTTKKLCKTVASEKMFEKIVPDVDVFRHLDVVKMRVEEQRGRLKMMKMDKKRGEKRPWAGGEGPSGKRMNLGGIGMGGGATYPNRGMVAPGRGGGGMGGMGGMGNNNYGAWGAGQQPQQQQQQMGGMNWNNGGGYNNGGMNNNAQGAQVAQTQQKQTPEEQQSILEEARKKGWAWDGNQWIPAHQVQNNNNNTNTNTNINNTGVQQPMAQPQMHGGQPGMNQGQPPMQQMTQPMQQMTQPMQQQQLQPQMGNQQGFQQPGGQMPFNPSY